MPFNAAAALQKIKNEIPEAATSATSATREEIQRDSLLLSCYSAATLAENASETAFESEKPAEKASSHCVSSTEIEGRADHESAPDENPQNPQNPIEGSRGLDAHNEIDVSTVNPAGHAQIQRTPRAPPVYAHRNPVRQIMERLEGDMELYSEALRLHGPMSYGQAMHVLGWGATRAGMAEQDLRKAGRITFNQLGRAVLVDRKGEANAD